MSDLSHIYFAGIDPPARPVRAAAPLLCPVANTAPPGQSPEVAISSSFLDWLLAEAGLNAALYRPVALRRRLPACLRTLRVSCVEAAQALLDEMPSMRAKAVDTLLIGVSDFFRDPAVFECLRQLILPELFTTRPGLRVYSAGCSGGQELYSIAILLAECWVLAESSLLGVDCRPEAIAQAQEGLFQEAELKQLPWQYRQRCLHGYVSILR